MEIILAIACVAILVGVSFLKPQIPKSILVPLSIFIGSAMLIWFWVFSEGQLPARVIITVLILSGMYTTLRARKPGRMER